VKRLWIRFWYNDITRFIGVLCGGHLLLWVPVLKLLNFPAAHLSQAVVFGYIAILLWACIDNDYTKLRSIGRDEYGRKLSKQ